MPDMAILLSLHLDCAKHTFTVHNSLKRIGQPLTGLPQTVKKR